MATKSFQCEFKFDEKASQKFVNALEDSKKVKHNIRQPVKEIKDKESIDKLMASFLRK